MATILNHKELNINLPDGFSLELRGGMVFLKDPEGKTPASVLYFELARRKEELEAAACHQEKS